MADSKPKKTSEASKAPKVFDVAHPSKTVAPSTSKPVIVGHTNTMKRDPMVAPLEEEATVDPAAAPEKTLDKPKREKTIMPASVQPTEETPEPDEENAESSEKETPDDVVIHEELNSDDEPLEDSAEEHTVTEETEETENEEDSGEEETAEGGALDAIVAGVNTKKDRKDQEEKEAKAAEEIQSLISSKKYYVKTHLPPGKRNMRWLIVLIILAILVGAGWYLGMGPGKDLWNKVPETQSVAPAPTPVAAIKDTTPAAPLTSTYKNSELGVSFIYPADWKVEATKDQEFPTRDVLTLTSPTETIKASVNGAATVDSEVYLRSRIFLENTTNDKTYASDLVDLTSCTTEDVIVGTTNLKFVYLDRTQASPYVSQVSVGTDNCQASGAKFTANDQIQLSTKKNTYIMYTEYIFSDAYLKKNGTTDAAAITTAQESGVVAAKDNFKAGKNFIKFQDVVKSFKEL